MSDDQPRTRTRTRTEAPPVQIEGNEQTELGATMLQITKRMGSNVIRKASVVPGFCHLETGIFTLDFALLGGIPEGLVTMIYGWESSGKTTTAMRVVGAAQRKYQDKACVWIDAEQTFDNQWGARHGVDTDRLFIAQPESGEHAVDIMDGVLRAQETSLVVLDSLPALVPQAEIDSSAEDSLVAKRSQLIGRMCSKILSATLDQRHRGNFPTVILINQWRMKIGVSKGDPRVLPGGMQPKFLATTMFETKNKEHIGRDSRGTELVDYNEHSFTVKKSKVGNSLRNGEFVMIRDPEHPLGAGGIDDAAVVATYAKRFGLISGGGQSWHVDGVDRKFGKLAEIVEFCYADPYEFMVLKQRVVSMQREFMGLKPVPPDGWLCGGLVETYGE